jgi:hypothetical protein
LPQGKIGWPTAAQMVREYSVQGERVRHWSVERLVGRTRQPGELGGHAPGRGGPTKRDEPNRKFVPDLAEHA